MRFISCAVCDLNISAVIIGNVTVFQGRFVDSNHFNIVPYTTIGLVCSQSCETVWNQQQEAALQEAERPR